MKNKRKKLIVLVGVVVWFLLVLFFLINSDRVKVKADDIVKVTIDFGGANISVELTKEEKERVSDIFSGKKLYKDDGSCAFSDGVMIMFGEEKSFNFSSNCLYVFYEEKDKYFEVSESERDELNEIIGKYEFNFTNS